MNILSITAGAAGMYCGSCSRDNAQALELLARGHQVTLQPVYTPTNPDERNVSEPRILFGGISVYLQQYAPIFRTLPRFLDRLWDSPRVIAAFAGRSISNDPKMLGDLTVSMLEGDRGVLKREFDKLLEWIAGEPVPDVVNLPNSLLIGLAAPLKRALKRPIVCTLQGEDLFLDGLVEPYRTRAIDLIRRQVPDVDRFLSVSDFYVPIMSKMLAIPPAQIAVVPLGISMEGYARREAGGARREAGGAGREAGGTGREAGGAAHGRAGEPFRIGYCARLSPEKGLHALAEAYRLLRAKAPSTPMRLEAAGYLAPAQASYLEQIRATLANAGLSNEFTYHGAVDRNGKLAFLRSLDVLSVPAPYDEPKGTFLLEAMAAGVPVVQPRRGAFPEIVEKTGGGVIVAPDDPSALADALLELSRDRARLAELGRRAYEGVRAHYTIQHAVDRLLEVYSSVTGHSIRDGSPA
jgi:glycosyltransferase involved in cell wall biosynthesis